MVIRGWNISLHLRIQGHREMRSFKLSGIHLFVALISLSLKAFVFYFRGNVPTLPQASSYMWPPASVPVGTALVVTLENMGGLSLSCPIYKLGVASICVLLSFLLSIFHKLSSKLILYKRNIN